MSDLFAAVRPACEQLREGVYLLSGFADPEMLFHEIPRILAAAPLRHMVTPGGRQMRVAMSNCGPFGWVSERSGYRYAATDPESGSPWPSMPQSFRDLAARAADAAGFGVFEPDACLVNCYTTGSSLSAHQDMDEADRNWPIVSVSIGVSATFLLYGLNRGGTPQQVRLHSGDVIVFGGPSRLIYHGVKRLEAGYHPLTGSCRYNLTFRRAR